MRKNIFILVFITLSSFLFGQKFQKALITKMDGTKKIGLVKGKSLSNSKEIKYKDGDNGKTEKIAKNLIKSIDFFSATDNVYHIENVTIKNYKKYMYYMTTSEWMLRLTSGYYNLYVAADYSFDNSGDIKVLTGHLEGRNLPELYYFIKKEDEKQAEIFALHNPKPTYLGLHKFLKNNVIKFMSDDKDLVDKVENKNLSTRSVEQIVKRYNEFKNSNQ